MFRKQKRSPLQGRLSVIMHVGNNDKLLTILKKRSKKMYSVTGRIRSIKQPRGGYIKPSEFKTIELNDGQVLNGKENVHATIIGMTVDYLTRFMIGANLSEAFKISIKGVILATKLGVITAQEESKKYLRGINGLDDDSIINACKMVTFDVWYRNLINAPLAKTARETNPDKATIENIRTMVKRSINFFDEYGPITVDGFTFEPNGYTETVSTGDGDFLTADTLWDFKVTKSKPTNKHTLQLLMYWIMGQHSGKPEYKNLTKLGIFNPRLNTVYLLDMGNVSAKTIADVEKNVICY